MTESQIWGWEVLFLDIESFLRASGHQLGYCSVNYGTHTLERMELYMSSLVYLKNLLDDNIMQMSEQHRSAVNECVGQITQLISCLRSLAKEWHLYVDTKEQQADLVRYHASIQQSGRGRPRFLVAKEQLEYLHSLGFTWTDVAHLIGVSRMTVYRRREEYGMLDEPITVISDSELRQKVLQIKTTLPEVGESIVIGQLRSMGYKVTRWRVREILRSTDPVNVTLRWPGGATARRQYSVPGPNSLWHVGMYACMHALTCGTF